MHRQGNGWGEATGGTRRQAAGVLLRLKAAAALFPAITLLLTGCARSEKLLYMRHLTTVIEPNQEVPAEVVAAFGLDRSDPPRSAVASAPAD